MSPVSRSGFVFKTTRYQDGRIRVRWHRGERTLAACIRHRHPGPPPDMMTWGTIGYTSRLPFVHIDGTLNSARYISDTFLDTENVRLLPWPARSPDLSPIENVRSMVAEVLDRHHTPVTTVDELRFCIEAAWSYEPVHAIEVLILLPEVVAFGTDLSGSTNPNFLKI
ncbi:uncharacterized protein TNCV_4886751 [Trichonephila clavipes]|uniref:Tc1-like transposase DDE domain-containing protein n=1 Tax=Trichonephila clavipes TaxID=2585209 RepID=A0A8X6RNC2_TRICX|nr:uncharacterized protein TNCV_4886751 [Trichonephila clavipes]